MSAVPTLAGLVNASATENPATANPPAAPAPTSTVTCPGASPDRPALQPLLAMLRDTSLAPTEPLIFAVCQSDACAAAKAWADASDAAADALDALLAAVAREVNDALGGNPMAPGGPSANASRRRLLEAGVIDLQDNEFLACVSRVAAMRAASRSAIEASWAFTMRRMVYAAAIHLLKRRAAWRNRIAA
ncbi:MAG TPA: hypothetical protein P5081_10555 [Phycisphaerae bacterium]|nr:hypothetical protein [Phycisphaerae bacterium]HRW53318.1 hypothetical protein [Phycisphaerae bacterium]